MSRIAFRALGIALVGLGLTRTTHGQAFDCVLLNDNNTNIFVTPDDCFVQPEHQVWCDCVRSLFTNPVKGQTSGFNQAIEWILDQPGIGNHRIEVSAGTVNLAGVTVGQVIGTSEINELVPTSAGVPPGTFFIVRSDVVVTAVGAESIDFEVVQKELSPVVPLILRYDPLDDCHYNGVQYRGRLTRRGPDQGFVLEYRYPTELFQPGDAVCAGGYFPAIEQDDAGGPGFTVRSIIKFITRESGIYTLPTTTPLAVTTTLRRFTESTLQEILEVGDDDLCVVKDGGDPTPCKIIEESLTLEDAPFVNHAPTAAIVMVDVATAAEIPDQSDVQMACGSARILFRGSNSTDGDGGLQTLSYEWSISEGPDGGAEVPAATKNFVDTEIEFRIPDTYEIGLLVNDGAPQNNSATAFVTVIIRDDFNVNTPPTAIILTQPDPAEVEIAGGKATLQLDGSTSANGAPGIDDCMQTLTYSWTAQPGPGPVTFGAPTADKTSAEFTVPGSYVIELEVDDGAAADSVAFTEVEVTVTRSGPSFHRGDSNNDGAHNISDPVNTLNVLFLGTGAIPCQDAADSNDDGQVNISDPVNSLNVLFLGTGAVPPPAVPERGPCGLDPTAETPELGCATYTGCRA